MTLGILLAALLAQADAAPAPAAAAPVVPVLTLEAALEAAQAANLDLRAARERLAQSKELHWKAWSALLPAVNASATYTHNGVADVVVPLPVGGAVAPGGGVALQTEPIVIQRQDQIDGQLLATQPLLAPQAWFDVAAARASEQAAEDGTEQTRRDVLFGVADAYYRAAGLKQVVGVQERQLAIALQHEKDARSRLAAGTVSRVALLRAEIDRAGAEQDLKRAQNAFASARVALATLLGRGDGDFDVAAPPSPPPLPGEADAQLERALRDRPDVRAAAAQVSAAARARDGVVARYLPTVGAFGRYAYSNAAGFTGDQWTWAVGLSLRWSLLDGLLRESDLRESAAKIREAEANQGGLALRVRQEVQQARLELDSAVANREKARERLALARENQRLVDANYRAGAATYLEASDANGAWLQAELAQVVESLGADLAALRVLKAAGAFNPS